MRVAGFEDTFRVGFARGTRSINSIFDTARSAWNTDRERTPWEISIRDTWKHYASSWEYGRIVSDSQRLFANVGVIKGAALEKADYSFGMGWVPRFAGSDTEWGDKATALLAEWHKRCNILGPRWDWNTSLMLASVCIDRDGRTFAAFMRGAGGEPVLQFIPGHRIGGRGWREIPKGPYKGCKVIHGVLVDGYGREIGYNFLGEKPSEDRIYPAEVMGQFYHAEWWDGVTGLPSCTHAINDIHDLKDTSDFEKLALKAASSVGLLEYNEAGTAPIDGDDTPVETVTTTAGKKIDYEAIWGGMVRYFRSNSGSKLEAFTSARPPETWHRFVEYLLRTCFTGLRWPIEIAWDPSKIGGASVRLISNKAQRAVAARQKILIPLAQRADSFAVACFMDMGLLPFNGEWYKWAYTMPPRITVDEGKDGANFERMYRLGADNLSDYLEAKGKDFISHTRQRAWEVATRKGIAAEYGVDPVELGILTPNGNQPAGGGQNPPEHEEPRRPQKPSDGEESGEEEEA